MSEHEWCRDTARDEAVRAAEDAAAVPSIQHRDLPEQVSLLWASVSDILGRVVRLEAEMDAGQDEEAAPAGDPAFPGEGIRTERVTLEFHIKGPPPTQWPWSYILRRSDAFRMLPGESVRVVEDATIGSGDVFADVVCGSTDDEVVRLTDERNAAREEAERLRATVARLERRYLRCVGLRDADGDTIAELKEKCDALRARVAELEAAPAAPPEPRGWLTAEEREAVRRVRDHLVETSELTYRDIVTFNALLARSSPPRVRRPQLQDHLLPQAQRDRDDVWIAAIREAGGEVE